MHGQHGHGVAQRELLLRQQLRPRGAGHVGGRERVRVVVSRVVPPAAAAGALGGGFPAVVLVLLVAHAAAAAPPGPAGRD